MSVRAATRGLVSIKDAQGQQVALYKASHALLIGVSDYTAGWADLPGVKKDIPRMKSALEAQGFNVTVVMDPTHDQLTAAIDRFIDEHGYGQDNRLLFYYSGHGYTLKKGWGGDMGYIVPADTPDPNSNRRGFESKALDMEQIEVYAKRINAKHALFLFDSCFSGSIFALSKAAPAIINYKTSQPVRQFITAGSADEEVPDKSIFCQQFLDALTGEADGNRDGYITGSELGEYLQTTVVNYSYEAQHPQYGKIRHRLLDKGDFVFALRKSAPSANERQKRLDALRRAGVIADAESDAERARANATQARLAELRMSRGAAQRDMILKKAQLEQLVGLQGDAFFDAAGKVFPDAVMHTLLPRLRMAEQRLGNLRTSHGDTHPDVRQQQAEIDRLTSQLKEEEAVLKEALRAEYNAAVAKLNALDEDLAAADPSQGTTGALAVRSPVHAEVRIDGGKAYLIEKGKTLRWDRLVVGNHRVLVTAGERAWAETVQVRDSQTTTVVAVFESIAPQREPARATSGPIRQVGETISFDLGNGIKMDFCWIPPGEFMMGSPSSERGRKADEGPQHRVNVTKGFWMGKYEVTQAQWQAVMGNSPLDFKKAGGDAPVEQVKWEDSQEFLRRLNARFREVASNAGIGGSDVVFALPTEAEWEYACRAGTTAKYYTGNSDSDLAQAGWYRGNSGGKLFGQKPHAVGQKAPNEFGLYDMHGNVWEWCADRHAGDYYAKSPSIDPQGPSSGGSRVLRGGSADVIARYCRAANRNYYHPDYRYTLLGLRVVARPRGL